MLNHYQMQDMRKQMGMMFQAGGLFTDITVFENVAFSLKMKSLPAEAIDKRVGEALAMVKVMDQEKVTTIVESKAECASACAQILFLSGVHRFVLDGGRLGLHSCREGAKGGQSTSCNDLIAQNALAHGTSYASIMSFMQFTDPGRMRWFDSEEADCWGFTRWPPGIDRGSKTGEMPLCIRKPPTSTGKLPTR